MVASDADKNNLRENGDVITISATNPLSKQLKKTQFIIAGGECTCGISKKAGVVVLIFD